MTNERRKQIRKRRRQRNRNKNRFLQWFKKLSKGKKTALIVGVILLVLIVAAVLFVMSKFRKLDTQEIKKEEIHINEFEEEVGVGYTNFVLFGGDSRKGEVEKNLNTDTIIIVSLNNETKEVKMVSVYRDTLLDTGNNSIRKCNSAYAAGGAAQAINMLNKNLDLNIQQYVTVDFGAVSDVVDMLGGIEVDVSEAEWRAVNKYIDETGMVAGKKANHLTHGGLQTLDGVQATTYARIRKGVGDDYARTERQRLVIKKVFEKALKTNFSTLSKIADKVFPQVSTNLAMTEILKYAKDVAKYKIVETSGFPFEKGGGVIPGRGDCVFPITLKKNVSLLHEFLYGTEGYKPSSTVETISGKIAGVVGNREVQPNTTWTDDGSSTTTDTPGTDTSGTDTPGTDTSGTDTPGTDTPGTDTPGTDTPGTDTPGTDTPGTDTPGTDTPGIDTPGSGGGTTQ